MRKNLATEKDDFAILSKTAQELMFKYFLAHKIIKVTTK